MFEHLFRNQEQRKVATQEAEDAKTVKMTKFLKGLQFQEGRTVSMDDLQREVLPKLLSGEVNRAQVVEEFKPVLTPEFLNQSFEEQFGIEPDTGAAAVKGKRSQLERELGEITQEIRQRGQGKHSLQNAEWSNHLQKRADKLRREIGKLERENQ